MAVLAVVGLATPVPAQQPPATTQAPNTWNIDSNHSSAQFAVKHMMVSTVRGTLGQVSGTIAWDGKDVNTIQTDVTIDVSGLGGRPDDPREHQGNHPGRGRAFSAHDSRSQHPFRRHCHGQHQPEGIRSPGEPHD
jgi:hypothetical protein